MILATQKLLEHKTADYEASRMVHGYGTLWYYEYRRKPPFRRFFHVPAMLANWRVQMALQTFEGAITSLTHFFVDEEDAAIKEFLIDQITRWWRNSASKMIYGALPYGFYPAEILYRVDNQGRLAFNTLKSFVPVDAMPVTLKGELVGIKLRNFNGSKVNYIGGEKAFWHVHWREWDPWWGQSRCYGAYEPWLELVSEGGGLDVRRLYFHRNVLQNDVIYYDDLGIQDEQGNIIAGRDIARSMVEKQRAGGVYSFPSTRDENGNLNWFIETKDTTGGGELVLENVERYTNEIAEGMGISPEIFHAAETGSGFSGRKIPETAFRGILTSLVNWMINDIDEQCFRALVRHNFKVEPSYNITPFGIVRDEGDEGNERPMGGVKQLPKQSLQMAVEGQLAV